MSDRRPRGNDRRRKTLDRRITFRITDRQARELDRMVERGMNPSSEFRQTLERMMRDARRKRF